jgi:hypothetical protein
VPAIPTQPHDPIARDAVFAALGNQPLKFLDLAELIELARGTVGAVRAINFDRCPPRTTPESTDIATVDRVEL